MMGRMDEKIHEKRPRRPLLYVMPVALQILLSSLRDLMAKVNQYASFYIFVNQLEPSAMSRYGDSKP
jgi:hypothetical protein